MQVWLDLHHIKLMPHRLKLKAACVGVVHELFHCLSVPSVHAGLIGKLIAIRVNTTARHSLPLQRAILLRMLVELQQGVAPT